MDGERFVTQQVFDTVTGFLDRQIQAVTHAQEEQGKRVEAELRRVSEAVNKAIVHPPQAPPPPPPPVDHGALAAQRAMDLLERRLPKGGGGSPVLYVLLGAALSVIAMLILGRVHM